MEDILRDYGIKPQGKSAPMGSSKSLNTTTSSFNFNFNTVGGLNNYNNPKSSPSLNTVDDIFSTSTNQSTSTHSNSGTNLSAVYDDVFSGPAQPKTSHSTMAYNDIFQSFSSSTKPSTAPIYDAPRYDDDIFGGVQGVKSPNTMPYDDVFASVGGSAASPGRDSFDDLLGGFSVMEPAAKARSPSPPAVEDSAFDDLLPGFGKSEPAEPRATSKTKLQQPNDSSQKPATDPFVVVLEADSFSSNASSATFHDPLEEFGMPTESASMNDRKSSTNGTIGIDDIFDGFSQAVPSASSPVDNFGKDQNPLKTNHFSSPQTKDSREAMESKSPKKVSADNLEKNHAKIYSSDPLADFDIPSGIADTSIKSSSNTNNHSLHEDSAFSSNLNSKEASLPEKPNGSSEIVYDRWITVDDIQLFTQPTSAPPPSRLPPPLVIKQGPSKSYREAFGSEQPSVISSIDELEEFAMGRSQGYAQQREDRSSYEEDIGSNSAAAAIKDAMDKAEAKLKVARKVREKEKEEDMVKARQSEKREGEERPVEEVAEHEERERVARAAREAREREEREKEERERERLRIEKERERNKIAVERATKEARERAAIEAREKAQRAAVERATREARERAAAEARERAQRAAVEKIAAEARERAAAEARERAAAEATERAAAEAKERAERAAVERATAEVRLRAERAAVERATAEVRGRAAERASAERAAAAKERQMRNDNDLESFFSMGARPSSAPRQRPATPDAFFNAQTQNKGFSSEAPQKTSSGVPSGLRKASSVANMTDDWTSLFGTPSADEFQEVQGETEERRRARLERHQRTRERTVKALAEKNERDMQVQRDQAERNRFSETLDAEIKRWAAGKEGNLRALLSTLQYVLWPEAGWQPVSLTDVITGASVKKVYRKATLCVHPDKVQQKGATIQQKYVAEKVFDLLKEAWNKFNSEELF